MILATDYVPLERSLVLPASAATLAGFRRWVLSDDYPDIGQVTFCQGELLVDMSPQRLDSHSKVKAEIYRALGNLLRQPRLGTLYDDRTLLSNESADLSTEPDATYVTFDAIQSGRVVRTRSSEGDDYVELVGAPDLVVEVVSPSSVEKDTRKLRTAYHAAGIPEYWLVDATGQTIKFEILVRDARRYRASRPVRGWHFSPVLDRSFRLVRERDPLGDWQYTLLVKE
jgi:Uma2 family endonuclease